MADIAPNVSQGAESQAGSHIEPSYIVGVGASAGGLEALESFFKTMPPDTGLAFVVVQHLSPDYKSLMVELLSKRTRMSVQRAEDGMAVHANHIYLIPPKNNLTIIHGTMILRDQESSGGLNLPIDIFLRSLAEDKNERSIAVILSGTGSDGTRGVRAIKEHNGLVMVQDEKSAHFDGMPRAAASTGLADFVLPPQDMPRQLTAYVQNPPVPGHKLSDRLLGDEDGLTRVFAELRDKTKVDFTFYKPSTIIRRIERRMQICKTESIEEYVQYLQDFPGEIATLYRELLIGVTSFFRDSDALAELAEHHIPGLLQSDKDDAVRIWVAGCSTGEEAYTLAILAHEAMERGGIFREVKIFATDLDREAIVKAGIGIYPESIAADLTPRLLSKYFHKKGDEYKIARHIREMVVFAQHNLVKDPPFTNIDLVSCRNLLIYLQPVLQQKALGMFNFSLRPNGILYLGNSESVGDMLDYFAPLHKRFKIYQSRGKSSPPIRTGGPDFGTRPSRRPLEPTGRPTARPGSEELVLMGRLLDLLAKHFVPLSVVVNEQLEVVHVVGNTEGYFQLPSGRTVNDISRLAAKDLSIPLTTGIQKVFRTGEEMSYTNVRLRKENRTLSVHMRIVPFEERKGREPLVAVFLDNRSPESIHDRPADAHGCDLGRDTEERIADLELDLQFTKENLQATIEELETSNEELQAANEELLASNEELQSTNEELQATNEELFTVNAEYQSKINELTELNNDVENLLTNSRIGQLLLDEDLVIRKFSDEVNKIFKIMEKDVGRPITHVAHDFVDFEPLEAIRSVQENNRVFEKDVGVANGRHYLVRILPYHIGPNTFSGVVVTFVDITKLKSVESRLEESRRRAEEIMQHMPAGLFLYSLNSEGALILDFCNPEAERMTGVSMREWGHHTFEEIWPNAEKTGILQQFIGVVQTGTPCRLDDIEYEDQRIKGTYRVLAFRLPDNLLAVSFEDTTYQHQMQKDIRAGKEELSRTVRLLIDAERVAEIGSWSWDVAQDKVTWSDELFRIFGLEPSISAPPFSEHKNMYLEPGRGKLEESVRLAVEKGIPYEVVLDLERKDKTIRHCIARGTAEKNGAGEVVRLYGSLQDVTERIRIENDIKQERDRIAALFNVAEMTWWEWDPASDTLRLSENCARILGIPADETKPSFQSFTSRLHPEDMDTVINKVREIAQGKTKTHEFRYRLRGEDGTYISALGRIGAVSSKGKGIPVRVIGTIQSS